MPDNRPGDVVALESEIGPRGQSHCDAANRALFRRWITAKGWGADFAAILSVKELNIAYNNPKGNGGEPGRDAWLDKRLAEFRNRQNEAQGGQGGLPLGADLGDAKPGDAGLDLDDILPKPQNVDDILPKPQNVDDILPKPQNVAEYPEYKGQDEAKDKAKDQDDLAALFRQFHDERLLQAVAGVRGNGPDKATELAKTLSEGLGNAELDGQAIKEIVDRCLDEAFKARDYAPREIVIKNADGELMGKIESRLPPWFARVLNLLQQGQNVMLVGPPGCGKSHNARTLADALQVKFGMVSGSAGASESQLTGWILPIGEAGRFEYVPSQFVQLYEEGNALFCFDEKDAFDANMLVVANGALANGHFPVPHRYHAPEVVRGKNMMIIATANTYGTGGNIMFAGRNALDATTLDRYVIVTVDYDEALERDIAEQGGLTADEAQSLWSIRRKTRENTLRRCISTRAFQKAAAMKAIGDTWPVIIDTLLAGWTADERAKVGV